MLPVRAPSHHRARRHQPGKRPRTRQTNRHSRGIQQKRLARHQLQEVARPRPERHADTEFVPAPAYGVSHHAVYPDGRKHQRDRFPAAGVIAIRAADAWHSTVTEAELVATCRLLNPEYGGTAEVTKRIAELIERRPAHRTVAPDREMWLVAGVLSGVLTRLQGYGRVERRRVLNDALIFATARKHGMTVLTRNTDDFDFLQQLEPSGRVVFYEQL
jgi:predicted nucleic acid-binding protein